MKSFNVLLVVVAVLLMSVTAQATLVAQWNFNETTGTTAADSSGNGHTLQLGDGTNQMPDWTGSAADFESTQNDYMTQAYNADVALIGKSTATVDAWVTPETYLNNGRIIQGCSYSLYTEIVSGVNWARFSLFLTKSDGTKLQKWARNSSADLGSGLAARITGTYDGQYIKLYVNNNLIATTDITADGLLQVGAVIRNNTGDTPTWVGNGTSNPVTGVIDRPFDGLIDKIVVANTVIPEPATIVLLGGMGLIALIRRK